MSTKPMLFRPEMVRAILSGQKTETRRLKRRFAVGDLAWVRETWRLMTDLGQPVRGSLGGLDADWLRSCPLRYRADDDGILGWRPAIHMPRWACRLWLLIDGVGRERLLDIDEAGARREGVENRDAFLSLWGRIHGPGSADLNPWVWVVRFRPVSMPKGWSERGQ